MNKKELKENLRNFYKGKKVFVTGHTGFKGSWLCLVLKSFGAEVYGYSLDDDSNKEFYRLLRENATLKNGSEVGNDKNFIFSESFADIRDLSRLRADIENFQPEILIHLAAQPLVKESYENPVDTYDVNVMGTVNVLEASRKCLSLKSVVNVTTDKVYENKEWQWGYRENESLNGYDPYSNSKSCSELVTETYRRCFFKENKAVSAVRAGNVIGGGDFAKDRILPDCIRCALSDKEKKQIIVRNPYAVRPYQYVLEPIFGYLLVAMAQYNDKELQGSYNIGPNREDCIENAELVELFCQAWGEGLSWIDVSEKNAVHEAGFLALDSTKIKMTLGYEPTWDIKKAVEKTVEWTRAYQRSENVVEVMKKQIEEFFTLK